MGLKRIELMRADVALAWKSGMNWRIFAQSYNRETIRKFDFDWLVTIGALN
jgi:hypothetical protein